VIALAMLAMAAQAQASCAVQGTIVDGVSGNGLARVRVYAVSEGNAAAVLRRSGEGGRFCFEQLTAGKYRVEARRSGYLDGEGPAVEVARGRAMPDVRVKLLRRPVVSGTVLRPDGQPAPGSELSVWRRNRTGPYQVSIIETDDRGMFRLSDLAPGTYYLSAKRNLQANDQRTVEYLNNKGERPRVQEAPTYFPGVLAFAEARPIVLKAGQEVNGILIGLREGTPRRLSGRVVGFSEDLTFEILPLEEGQEGVSFTPAPDGQFMRGDLAPGKYVVYVDGDSRRAEQVVDLTNGDVDGMVVQPQPTFAIPVTVTGGDGSKLTLMNTGARRELHRIDHGQISGLLPGVYRLWMTFPPSWYIKSVTLKGKPVAPDRVELSGAQDGPLEVALSSGMARIDGHLTEATSGPVTIVLAHGEEWRVEQTDLEGRFTFAAVVPGKYRIYAVEGFDEDSWDADAGAALPGTDVELAEREVRRLALPVVHQ